MEGNLPYGAWQAHANPAPYFGWRVMGDYGKESVIMDTVGSAILIILVVLAGAAAQIIMKRNVNSASLRILDSNPSGGTLFFIRQLLLTPTDWVALFLYAGGFVVWMLAFRCVTLNFAYLIQA